jgi:hypothetical protein
MGDRADVHTFPQSDCLACPPASSEGEPLNPCPTCGEHVNAHIAATSPDCPHGWGPPDGPADLVELHAEAWIV